MVNKTKIKYLYHGSAKELAGDFLLPKKARDLDDTLDNTHKGVYASDVKNEAIAMGILSSKYVKESSCGVYRKKSTKVDAIIYKGWPKQKYLYLHFLPRKSFVSKPRGSHQYVSFKAVKPIKTEKLLVKDFMYLIRKATKKEKRDWKEKYAKKII